MDAMEVGLISGNREPSYSTYRRKTVVFEHGVLAEKVTFSTSPENSPPECLTHVRLFYADGSHVDVPLSVNLTVSGGVTPVLVCMDLGGIEEWREEDVDP